MTAMTEYNAETTVAGPADDAMANALRSLRVSGSLLLCEEYAPPWAIDVPAERELAELLGAPADLNVVAFHLVRRGHFELQVGRADRRVVDAGELVLCPGGQRHRLSQGSVREAPSLAEVLARPRRAARPSARGATPTALVCGAFFLRDVTLNPLVRALPKIIKVDVAGPTANYTTRGVADLLLSELGAPRRGGHYVVERLLELLCALAFSAYADQVGSTGANWFRAIRDPAIGSAMAAIHASPGEAWSVRSLARRAALSPSRFAARFREVYGESPMHYLTRWRMHVACQQLRAGGASIATIADAVGYESVPSFSRVFKKLWGAPPSSFRSANLE